MQRLTGMRKKAARALVAVLSVALVFTMMPLTGGSAVHAAGEGFETSSPAVVVTGQGLTGAAYSQDTVSKEVSYSLEELKAMDGVTGEMYSSRKQQEPYTRSYFIADGVKVSSLLGDAAAGTDEISFIASDGYRCSFQSGGDYVNPSTTKALGLDGGRGYYDGFGDAKTKDVPAILSWAYSNEEGANGQPPEKKPSSVSDVGKLRLIVGQLTKEAGGDGADDMNQPLYNGNSKYGIQKVQVGEEVTETALTIGTEGYTRADILLQDYAERTYDYDTSGGPASDYVRGVPMSVLLAGYGEDDVVNFETADDYPVAASGYTVKELVDGDYMLAYEKGTGPADLAGIYETKKGDDSVYGFFRLYGADANGKPSKLVNRITVTSGSGINFSKSEYKHITNGGIEGQNGPYNIDAITGATLTIEGPGTEASVPLSVKDMEGRNGGCFRGVYKDTRGGAEVKRTYEGVDLYYILHNMSNGDNGIRLTDQAKIVKIKNRNRQTIAELTLKEIAKMHEDGDPALVAYGTAYEDGTNPRPFVFDGGTGGDADLGNEDGCLKFVYDRDRYGGNSAYKTFGNMAYIYVEREKTPGFKHDKSPYNTARNTQYVLTVTGDEIGREINYRVSELEKLVEYDKNGNVKDNGYGWRSEYSLANSSYWYVNTYEGVKLWSLLLHSGVDPAKAGDTETKVTFRSTDNYGGFDTFSLKQIADPDSFGFYEKNAADNNDGTYVPNENIRQGTDVTTGDKLSVGYPVLVSYGVNEYPYVIDRSLNGYLSGLSNDGGPLRVISGKMDYNHANGSNQAKLLDKIVVGEDKYHYSTHTYQPAGSSYGKLKGTKFKVVVRNGVNKTKKTYSVKDLEELLYGGTLSAAQLQEAKVKDYYETGKKGKYKNDLYEGVDLRYFIRDVLQLQGSQGKITFRSGKKKLTLDLKTVLNTKNGYNAKTKLGGLTPVIAFGKNGYPLVKKTSSKGYLGKAKLTKVSGAAAEATSYRVANSGGPLQVVLPRASKKAKKIMGSMNNITSIEIDLKPDKYAHVTRPYNKLGSKKLKVTGAGTWLTGEKAFTVNELEGKQSIITTKDYSIRDKKKKVTQIRYRGLPLYKFLKSTDVGLKTSADKVRVYTAARPDKPYEFALSDIMKTTYRNTKNGKKNLPVMLAFGSSSVKFKNTKKGRPLVVSSRSKGYSKKYKNSGGPLKLVIGQTSKTDVNSVKILNNVTRIEVTSGEQVSWNHSSAEVYKTYLDDTLEMKVVGADGTEQTKTLTVEQLEGMKDLIAQEKIYAVKENTWEGLNFWQLIQSQFADVEGIDDPITITVKAKDGYSVDAVEKAGLDGLKNGIKDGENRVPVLLAYGMDGYPLSAGGKSTPIGVGYDSTVDNKGGPLRLMVHNAQGACIMEVTSITIAVSGSAAAKAAAKPAAKAAKKGAGITAGSGEFTFYKASGAAGELPLAGLRSTAADPQGNIWVGTNGGGVSCLPKGEGTFTTYNSATEPALAGTVAYAVCPDQNGGVWISQGSNGGASHGAAYMKDGAITYYNAADNTVADDFVQEIKIDNAGNVWFGTAKGLTKYDPKADTWQSWGKNGGDGVSEVDFPAESVDNIEIDEDGVLWCGFYPDTNADGSYTGGFACFRDGKVIKSYAYTAKKDSKTEFYRMGDVWVRDIAVDKNGSAWAVASGSYSGMDNEGGKVWNVSKAGAKAKEYTGFGLVGEKYLNGTGQQTNPELRMVAFDPRGGLWFGTSANGILCIADPTVRFGKLSVTAQYSSARSSWPAAASSDSIYSLDFFGNVLYAGSNNGLAVRDFTGDFPEANPLKGVKPVIRSIKPGKKKAILKWNKVSGADGYIVYRAAKKNGKYTRAGTIRKAGTTTFTDKKLKKGKKYYYKLRAYTKVRGSVVYSKYSKIKKVTVK